MWDEPRRGGVYRIGADCADEDERIAVEGSENAAVVIDEETGVVVALYHGYSNAHEFAMVLCELGKRFNNAQIVPEWNNAGRAVIDHLRTNLHYWNLAPRERFSYGHGVGFAEGQYGFDTRGNTRPILLDRLQLGVNSRLWHIPSQYILDCLKSLAKRNGRRARAGHGDDPDDGAIALGLTGFGHDYLIQRMWSVKQLEARSVLPLGQPSRVPGGIRIESPRKRGLIFDQRFNTWR